ncbi:MAG: hypothetical protein IIB74_06850 [Proteobacteria bacterium]|nr:hypothetical protein [Pseudomonadota bacterium]
MVKFYLAVVLAGVLAMAALADELKVDLQAVVASGDVHPVDGISAAGQPDADAFKVFADSGYVAIIDLRAEHEPRGLDEQAVVEGLGMDYVLMPIVDAAAINFDNARRLDELLKQYDGPVLIHCGSSNRVGALLALRASLNGADDEGALQVGRDGGLTGLEVRVIEVLGEN